MEGLSGAANVGLRMPFKEGNIANCAAITIGLIAQVAIEKKVVITDFECVVKKFLIPKDMQSTPLEVEKDVKAPFIGLI